MKKYISLLLVLTLAIFHSFAADNSLTSAEWSKAFTAAKSSSMKYSINAYMDALNVGNISGSFRLANTKALLNANLSVSSSIDMAIQSMLGDTVTGEYNIYAAWQNSDGLVLDELKYTNKNSKEYISIKDNYLLSAVVANINSSIEKADSQDASGQVTTSDALYDFSKAVLEYSNYTYRNGKYYADFTLQTNDELLQISSVIGFQSKKLSTLEITCIDDAFSNPLTGKKGVLKFTFKSYFFNIGKTTVIL